MQEYVVAFMRSTDPSTGCTGKASGALNTSLLETENRRKFGRERTKRSPYSSESPWPRPVYTMLFPADAGEGFHWLTLRDSPEKLR